MIADLKPYAEYKESGLPWLGQVPGHWETRRLRHACDMRVSNVDKHTKPAETPVRLCNYVEVYKNERIRESSSFMAATASEDERVRFGLRKGDVLITKDSEQWNDIGVPALVEFEAPDLVCGYHLAILRSRPGLQGAFLHRALQSHFIATQFHVEANGVTRYGLSHGAIQGVAIPLPPPDEQAAIVRFLDWGNGRLERAIRAKRKVIVLLNEQKQAIIHRAVTRGLDPSVPLKPSGLPWLGDIPQHWEVRKLKFEMSFRGGGTPSKGNSAYWNGTIPWVSPKDMKFEIIHDTEDHITERAIAESSTNLVPSGSLLMVVRSGILQRTIPVARCIRDVALNQDMKALTSMGRLDLGYFVLFIRGCEKRLLREWTKQGATVESVEHQYLANTKVPIPPLTEQDQIVQQLTVQTAPINTAISRLKREIELLREYRTRLVADVVTGKLDVREAAARLPDEAVEPDAALDTEELSEPELEEIEP